MNDLKNDSDPNDASIPTHTLSTSGKEVINKIDRFLSYKYDAAKLSTLTSLTLIKIPHKKNEM